MIQSGSSGSENDEYIYGGYVRTIVGQKSFRAVRVGLSRQLKI